MSSKLVKSILKYHEGQLCKIECLRCGKCCYNLEVTDVPGYKDGIKPALIDCIHLIKAEVKNGVGRTSEIVYLALQFAKARGKAQIVVIRYTQADTINCWNKNNKKYSKPNVNFKMAVESS